MEAQRQNTQILSSVLLLILHLTFTRIFNIHEMCFVFERKTVRLISQEYCHDNIKAVSRKLLGKGERCPICSNQQYDLTN